MSSGSATRHLPPILADPPKRRLSDAMRSARLPLMLEIASHDPFRKRIKKVREQTILATVYSGNWPPTHGE